VADIAVTGASGFIGRQLVDRLVSIGESVVAISRRGSATADSRHVAVDDYINCGGLARELRGVDTLIHLAARAHQGSAGTADAELFRAANVQATASVARACLEAGVKRFVFVSSIGVHGSSSARPFTEQDAPAPSEAYARSKWEAERALPALCASGDMDYVIVRPPLVYGPHCPGNFARLARMVSRLPLVPLGDLRAARSFIGIDNLCDALWVAATHPGCRHGTFVVADEQTTCVAEVAQIMLRASGRGAWRMLSVPRSAMAALFQVAGRGDEFAKLSGELVVDPTLFRETTGWRARKSCQIGIEEAAASLLGSNPAPR
jgi:UDP-4-keto-D-FucNAc 4-reductase